MLVLVQATLRATGLWDNLVLFFCADNGGNLGAQVMRMCVRMCVRMMCVMRMWMWCACACAGEQLATEGREVHLLVIPDRPWPLPRGAHS